ncbi:MAG TPA: insulinase family protein, partial [Candidatus Avacidaminococcus intestinavium]|nr:insulinase family protein [Candidatus Avacidaminococcus intestinavium]
MKLVKNKDYSGFLVTRTIYIDEIQAEAIMLEHQQSGAKILYLGCEDDNKVFTIGFKTPPEDDAGTPHILEHSVLCGSRKYPLKEPFVELVKGSLNTFLNAMTYPDKTVYPLASRNNKDFHNLMDVYLDAVFYPNIHKNEYTLAQEGWHYAITSKDEPLVYNGVVYNEMKGVFSTADAVMDYEAMKALFPDNAYRFESGGLPEAIPTLTQEKFLEFHKKFYHPENAYIYLYGDLDIENTLKYLDQEYLSAFQKTGHAVQAITPQTPFHKTKELSVKYPVGEDEDTKNKTYLQMQIIVGNSTDVKTSMAMRLLETVLLEMNSSPL